MKNKKLKFYEQEHKYLYDGEELTSVTSFIASHFPEFNAKRISPYSAKAASNEIKAWKKSEELLEENFPKCVKLFGDNWKEEVKERKSRKTTKVTAKEVRAFWEAKGKKSRDEGTRIHNMIEDVLNDELDFLEYIDETHVLRAVNYVNRLNNNYGYSSLVKPEVQVVGAPIKGGQGGDLEIPIAGTIDLWFEKPGTNEVILVDWKTNNNLFKAAYNNKTGITEAAREQPDDSLTKYTLQLSLYAYLLEEFYNKKILKLVIGWLSDTGFEEVEVEYEKKVVEEMLKEDGYR